VIPDFADVIRIWQAFRNEAVRLQRKQNTNRHVHHLDDVLMSVDDTKIELRNLKFRWIPDFRIGDMSCDLPMSCLDLSLNLGNLRIEGEYEANNTTLRRWLPVSHVGRIVIGFSNVKANGKVGLLLKQDSFVPQNYDIKYEPTDVVVRVSYHVDGDNEVENEITNSDIGEFVHIKKRIKWVEDEFSPLFARFNSISPKQIIFGRQFSLIKYPISYHKTCTCHVALFFTIFDLKNRSVAC
jgi:hypothetical protein